MEEGVRAALAASSLALLQVPATQPLLVRARLVRIRAGSVTHREGETAEHLELVVDGLVRVFVGAPDGRTLTVRYCRRGALIGAVSMYATEFRMPAGIQAVVDTRCCAWRRTSSAGRRLEIPGWRMPCCGSSPIGW